MWLELLLHDQRRTGRLEGKEEGKIEGKAESILEILSEYGEISENLRECIMAEKDSDTLKRWVKLSVQTTSIEEFIEKM